jgi:hypothetical protein
MTAHLRLAGGTGTGSHWLVPAVQMAAVASGNWPLSAESGAAGWACFPRIATRTPIPDARSVRAGRDFAVATLHRWGAAERCEDIAVVVSELLTNALRHALPDVGQTQPRYPVRLGLLQPGRCAVADPSPRAPAPEEPGTRRDRPRTPRHRRARRHVGLHPAQPHRQSRVGPVLSQPSPQRIARAWIANHQGRGGGGSHRW